eukprot:scaffold15415_cov35-Prasinocladus_malaysianus.AAC.1
MKYDRRLAKGLMTDLASLAMTRLEHLSTARLTQLHQMIEGAPPSFWLLRLAAKRPAADIIK